LNPESESAGFAEVLLGASPTVAPAHEPSDGSTGFVSPPFV
jgi:hypothetical protein